MVIKPVCTEYLLFAKYCAECWRRGRQNSHPRGRSEVEKWGGGPGKLRERGRLQEAVGPAQLLVRRLHERVRQGTTFPGEGALYTKAEQREAVRCVQ